MVHKTCERSGWSVRRILRHLDIAPASYHRWCRRLAGPARPRSAAGSLYEVLPSERRAIVDFALKHPEIRHRELAWRMIDADACCVSSSTVYRVLAEARLVCHWRPPLKKPGPKPDAPTRPDERWETDIRYVKVGRRNYYLLSFLDVYSRYVVHHELLRSMDGISVSIAAATAIGTLPEGSLRPTIQSDNGSCFVAREFAGTLAENGVGHSLIRPHTPTDNAHVERYHKTIGEKIDEMELTDFGEARNVIDRIISDYNDRRLHSSLKYLRPVDYYRGNPEALLAERRRRLQTARELRKQENLKLRQRLLPMPQERTAITFPRHQVVSL